MIVAVVTGNLTKDPWVGSTKKGDPMCSFDMVANPSFSPSGQENAARFFHVMVFGPQTAPCGKYLRKGRSVTVSFRDLEADAYIAKDGKPRGSITGVAASVEFGGAKPEDADEPDSVPSDAPVVPEGYVEVEPDELPF